MIPSPHFSGGPFFFLIDLLRLHHYFFMLYQIETNITATFKTQAIKQKQTTQKE